MSTKHMIELVLAGLLVVGALWFRRKGRLSGERFVVALVVAAILAVIGSGVLSGFNAEHAITDLAHALGKWTYALVGVLAFAETGAFIGFIAPGEFTVILGGVIAGEGTINIFLLITLVWVCAFLGDTVSFFIGRRLGREFLLKHGERFKVTHERLEQVERFFHRHGGATILIGRFVGFVRPLAPFIAGSSRLPYRRFLPYSVLGTGLWGSTLCVLGYIFYRSFSKITSIAGRATLIFSILVGLIAAVVWISKRLRDPEQRRALERWADNHAVVRPLWHHVIRPAYRVLAPQVRFVWRRLTPGGLGIEFTSALAVSVVGLYVFAMYLMAVTSDPGPTAADDFFQNLASDTRTNALVQVAKVVSVFGSTPVTGGLVLAGALALAWRRRPVEMLALLTGALTIWIAVQATKAGVDRPRPEPQLTKTTGSSYPSGHAAYSTTYIALAVIGWRVLPGLATKTFVILIAALVTVAIGMSRIYLNVHWWSDVAGGWGLGCGIYAMAACVVLVVHHLRNTRAAEAVPEPS
jgi:membrane protein DedA with SNARE-associated domain/membrane-associated phospholipid phosphatase